MKLTREAAYLYVHSKELVALTKKLRKLSKKADKHANKHQKTRKEKHRHKHIKVSAEIRHLIEKHDTIIKRLRHHYSRFTHALKKEIKIN
jgi:hypothetical protein